MAEGDGGEEHPTRRATSHHVAGPRRARPDGLPRLRATLDELWSDALEVGRRMVETRRRGGRPGGPDAGT